LDCIFLLELLGSEVARPLCGSGFRVFLESFKQDYSPNYSTLHVILAFGFPYRHLGCHSGHSKVSRCIQAAARFVLFLVGIGHFLLATAWHFNPSFYIHLIL